MLYALVLSAVFALLLQFYLQNEISTQKHLRLQRDYLTAQLMVKLTASQMTSKSASVKFDSGICRYQVLSNLTEYQVSLRDGRHFNFTDK